MKKIIYSIAFMLFAYAGQAQGIVFSWEGELFTAPNPDVDSVRLFVENTSLVDQYLIGFNAKVFYSNANILLTGETSGLNPNFTYSSLATSNGMSGVASPPQTVNQTINGVLYDRFTGVSPTVAVGFGGLLLTGEAPIAPGEEGEAPLSAPVKIGTFRFRVEANNGGTGCFVTPPFTPEQQYTSSLTPYWDPDNEVPLPLTGPCATGCTMVYLGQQDPPDALCCASCGLLSESPLPVELIKFRATKYSTNGANIFWQTASEENVSHFEIERSRDLNKWELAGKASAHGTSQSVHTYTTIDHNVYDGRSARVIVYYRLKIIDKDGSFEYSGIETVRFTNDAGVFSAHIYPNPSSDELTIELNYGADTKPVTELTIYNNLGQVVYSEEVAEGAQAIYLYHASIGLVAGSYLLELRDTDHNTLSQERIIVQR